MNPFPQKISELPLIDAITPGDLLAFVDISDTSSAVEGKTKRGTFAQLKQNILNSVVIPKATTTSIGGVSVGAGLRVSDLGVLSAAFSGSYNDLIDKPTTIGNISDLSDVSISTIGDGDLLIFDEEEGAWLNKKLNYSSIQNIPDTIVLENTSVTLADLVLTGDLIVTGTTISNNFETLNVGTSEIILNDQLGKYTGTATAGSAIISNMSTTFNISVGDKIKISSNGENLTLDQDAVVTQIDGSDQIRLNRNFLGSGSFDNVVFEIEVDPIVNASILVNRSKELSSEIRWDEQGNRWKFSNDGTNFYNLPLPSEYGDFTKLINVPTIPQKIGDLTDVSSDEVGDSQILSWNGTAWKGRGLNSADFSSLSINVFGDVSIDDDAEITSGYVLKWNGSSWAPAADLVGSDGNVNGAIATPKETSSKISFYYTSLDAFPDASESEGAFAYAKSGGTMHYAHDNQWLQLALASNVQPNTDTLYSLGAESLTSTVNSGNGARIKLTPNDNNQNASSIAFYGDGAVSISKSVNSDILTISGKTYSIGAEGSDGEFDAKLNLVGSDNNKDSIIFKGANGLKVEFTDESTLTFRSPDINITQYTDSQAKDALGAAITGGTHAGITFQYNSENKTISSSVTGGGEGGGTVILYTLGVSSETDSEAIVSLTPSGGGAADTFKISGSGGTVVNWNDQENIITVSSTAPVNADWNATDGLAEILNKPTIPPAYSLPTASSTVLGGVKVDESTITISDGVISAASGGYVLPIASSGALGGIKIGSGLSIDEEGSVSVSEGGGTPLQVRNTISKITTSIEPGAAEELVFTNGYKTYMLLKLLSSSDAWIRIYVNQEAMIADRYRSEGNDPLPGSGVIADARTSDEVVFTPVATGFNNDSPVSNNIYVSVTNRDLEAKAIQVSLVLLRLEA